VVEPKTRKRKTGRAGKRELEKLGTARLENTGTEVGKYKKSYKVKCLL